MLLSTNNSNADPASAESVFQPDKTLTTSEQASPLEDLVCWMRPRERGTAGVGKAYGVAYRGELRGRSFVWPACEKKWGSPVCR